MNSTPPNISNLSDAKASAPEGKVYQYRISLLANLLNPPEAFIWRCAGVFSLGVCIWMLFICFDNPVGWLAVILTGAFTILAGAFFWIFCFRHGLPLYSKGKLVSLVITKQAVALEANEKFFYVPKQQVKVRRGLAGTHIISRWAYGDYLLVSKDAISFDQLKSEIES